MAKMIDRYETNFYRRYMFPSKRLRHFDVVCMLLKAYQGTIGTTPNSVLDVGCGAGWHLEAARAMLPTAKLTGVDRSKGADLKSLWMLGGDPNAEFIDMDLMSPHPLVSGKHDLVWCIDVAEHIRPDCSKILAKFIAGSTGKMLIFGGATTGHEGGHSRNHCNCRPAGYWAWVFRRQGLTYCRRLTEWLRRSTRIRGIRHLGEYIEAYVLAPPPVAGERQENQPTPRNK